MSWEFRLSRADEAGEVLGTLYTAGAPIVDVETSEASLEDVFMKLTERNPADAAR